MLGEIYPGWGAEIFKGMYIYCYKCPRRVRRLVLYLTSVTGRPTVVNTSFLFRFVPILIPLNISSA